MKKVIIILMMMYSSVSFSSDEICYKPINNIQKIMEMTFQGANLKMTAWQTYIDAVNIARYFVVYKKQNPKAKDAAVMQLAQDIYSRQATTALTGLYANVLMNTPVIRNDIINIVEADDIDVCQKIATYVFFDED
ncbi:MAG: hypothetical protein ABL867_05805 [Rickettsiales bacterium]